MKRMPMSRRLLLLFVPLGFFLMSLSPLLIAPENRIRLTALSDWIALVEIQEVVLGEEKVVDGIGCRQLDVEGRIVEMIRGRAAEDMTFRSEATLIRVVDRKKIAAKRGEQDVEFMYAAAGRRTGIEECERGHLYLVIRCAGEGNIISGDFFVEVADDEDMWRNRIQEREVPSGVRESKERE